MTELERDQLARDIYEGRSSVFFPGVYKPWDRLQACERGPWLIAAERAYARIERQRQRRMSLGEAA